MEPLRNQWGPLNLGIDAEIYQLQQEPSVRLYSRAEGAAFSKAATRDLPGRNPFYVLKIPWEIRLSHLLFPSLIPT